MSHERRLQALSSRSRSAAYGRPFEAGRADPPSQCPSVAMPTASFVVLVDDDIDQSRPETGSVHVHERFRTRANHPRFLLGFAEHCARSDELLARHPRTGPLVIDACRPFSRRDNIPDRGANSQGARTARILAGKKFKDHPAAALVHDMSDKVEHHPHRMATQPRDSQSRLARRWSYAIRATGTAAPSRLRARQFSAT